MNPFDQNLGYIDEYGELNGLGSKLRKGLKKVNKAVNKVRDKTVPKKIRKEVSRAAKNPKVQAVAAVALSTFGGPAVLAAMKGVSIKAAIGATAAKTFTAKGIGSIIAKEAGKKVASNVIGKQIEKKLISDAKKETAKIQRGIPIKASPPQPAIKIAENMEAVSNAAANVQAQFRDLVNDKEFSTLVQDLQAKGKSAAEISQIWQSSKAYKDIAGNAAQTLTAPLIYEQAIKDGIPRNQANAVAEGAAYINAQNEAGKQGTDFGKILLMAAPLALLALG